MEMVTTPNNNVIKGGILIGSTTNLGRGSSEISAWRNLNKSSKLPIITTIVVGTLYMVFTSQIMIIHVNKIADQPPMNLMATRGCKSTNAENPRGGYWNHML